jgi:hypothetical protein
MNVMQGAAQPGNRTVLLHLFARAKASFIARFYRLSAYVFFGVLGTLINEKKLPFMIEYRPDFHRLNDFFEYRSLLRAWLQGNEANNGGDLTRFYAVYQNVKQVLADGVPGDLVELGVYRGNSAAMLATLARQAGRRTYLFDTFEGFSAQDLRGLDKDHSTLFTDTSLSYVKKVVGEELVIYVQGYFPDSLKQIDAPHQIAVLHIDCDLHDPMDAALQYFYPLVAPGGLIIMHDYSSGYWAGITVAIDNFFRDKLEKPILIPDKSGTAVVRKMEGCVNQSQRPG